MTKMNNSVLINSNNNNSISSYSGTTITGISGSLLDLYKESEEKKITDTVTKEGVKKFLEEDTEIMDIVKKYLVDYLDKFMENPEELLIKELIKEKDEEIVLLKKEVEDLKDEIKKVNSELQLLKIKSSKDDLLRSIPYPGTVYHTDSTLPTLGDITFTSGIEINDENH